MGLHTLILTLPPFREPFKGVTSDFHNFFIRNLHSAYLNKRFKVVSLCRFAPQLFYSFFTAAITGGVNAVRTVPTILCLLTLLTRRLESLLLSQRLNLSPWPISKVGKGVGESVGCLYPQDFLRDFFNRHLPFLVALGLSVEHILTKFVENLFLWLSDFTLLVAESQAVFEQVGCCSSFSVREFKHCQKAGR